MPASESITRNPAGAVWGVVGLALTTMMLVGVGAIQLTEPLPTEGVFFLLALGAAPALLAMSVALWRGLRARRSLVASVKGPICSVGIRLAIVGFALMLGGAALLAADCRQRTAQKERWVAEAQMAVESMLGAGERIPADMREQLGDFGELKGTGFGGASWNIQGFHYLIADRDARFSNGTIPLRMVIIEVRRECPADEGITVHKLQVNHSSLYLQNAPLPKVPQTGLEIWVSHPELREL